LWLLRSPSQQIRELLEDFDTVHLNEVEGPATPPFGAKHLHLVSVIAQRH
jgi:hypothetical protein